MQPHNTSYSHFHFHIPQEYKALCIGGLNWDTCGGNSHPWNKIGGSRCCSLPERKKKKDGLPIHRIPALSQMPGIQYLFLFLWQRRRRDKAPHTPPQQLLHQNKENKKRMPTGVALDGPNPNTKNHCAAANCSKQENVSSWPLSDAQRSRRSLNGGVSTSTPPLATQSNMLLCRSLALLTCRATSLLTGDHKTLGQLQKLGSCTAGPVSTSKHLPLINTIHSSSLS